MGDGWRRLRLDAIGEIVTGRTPSTMEPRYWGGPVPFVTPGDLSDQTLVEGTERTLSGEGGDFVRIVPAGSVLVVCIASIGKVGVASMPCATNQQINAIIPSEGHDGVYVAEAIRRVMPALVALSGKTSVPILNKTQFAAIEIPVPPLDEQRRIAALLSAMDRSDQSIASARAAIARLSEAVIAQTLRAGGTRRTIAEIGRVVTGSTPSVADTGLWDGPVPFFTPGDVGRSLYCTAAARALSEAGASRARVLPPRAVLVVCIGATVGKLGITTERSVTNQQINAVVCGDTVEPEFLAMAISAERAQLRALAGTTAVPIVNKTKFERLEVLVPSLSEQRRLVSFTIAADAAAVEHDRVLARTRSLKRAVASQLLAT